MPPFRLRPWSSAAHPVPAALGALLIVLSCPAARAETFRSLSAGMSHACGVTSSGATVCWGDNRDLQVGDGTSADRHGPVPVVGLASGAATASAGGYHSCAVTDTGALRCWGYNSTGQLGDGTTTSRSTSVVVGQSGIRAVSAGSYHTCALLTTGGVMCWGSNGFGQLGDGTTTYRTSAVPVVGLGSGVEAIAAAQYHTCALTATHGVKCWGDNTYGQLGDGTTTNSPTPVPVVGLASGVAAIGASSRHTCAVTMAGAVTCWGYNGYGQLGDGTTTSSPTPVSVTGLQSGVAAVSASNYHTCAVTTAGGVKCWGYNGYGQLGDGTTTRRPAPVDVTGLTSGAAAVTAGGEFTCALTTGGAARCWGWNYQGQLGDGTTTNRSAPADVVFPACGRPSAGLIARFPLDGGSASDVVAGRAGETSDVSNVPERSGAPDGALRFTPSSWARVPFTAGDPLALSTASQLTLSIWLNADSLAAQAASYTAIVVGQSGFRFGLQVEPSGRPNAMACTPAQSCQFAYGTTGSIKTGLWYHLALRYDGIFGTLSLLLDGTFVTTTPVSFSEATADAWVKIGGHFDASEMIFRGQLDEARVYDRILDAAEIAQLADTCGQPQAQTSVTPSTGPLAGGTRVTVRGPGVGSATAVTIGGQPAPIVSVLDAATIIVTTPAASTIGARDIVLITPAGDVTLLGGFTFVASTTTEGSVTASADVREPALSGDGRWLAFVSAASDLVTGDTNGVADVFVRDRVTGTVVRTSVATTGAEANGASAHPRLSADGRFVVFQSEASALVTGDTNGVTDVFLHDRDADADGVLDEADARRTARVSVSSVGTQGDAASASPDISPDGYWVTFVTAATTLVAGDTNAVADVCLHHWPSGQTMRVSVATGGTEANGPSRAPQVSAGGRLVVFASDAANLVAGDTNGARDVFLHDRVDATTVRVSIGAGGVQGDGASDSPSIDAAGTTVVFQTLATNLVAGSPPGASQIVRYALPAASPWRDAAPVASPVVDIGAAIRWLISQNAAGAAGNGASTDPEVSDSGTTVAFTSTASNLAPGDTNQQPDVFVTTVDATGTPAPPQPVSVDASGNPATKASGAAAVSGDGRTTAFESDAGLTPATASATTTNVFVWGSGVLVDRVTPSSATVGTQPAVVLEGAGFTPGASVRFGSVPSPQVVWQSATVLVADVPPQATPGVVDLVLVNADGSSLTLPQAFTYTAAPGGTDADGDQLPDAWEAQVGLSPGSATGADGATGDADADGATNLEEYRAGTHPRGVYTRYLSEGATGTFFTTALGLANPSASAAVHAWLRFQRSDGTQVPLAVTIPPRQSRRVTVNGVQGLSAAEFATVVESDDVLAVHRTMTWDAAGRYGNHMEGAVAAPATTWYLAEGSTAAGFQLFYLLQNPGGVAADVEVRFLLPSGSPVVKGYRVPAGARFNVWVNTEPELANTDVSAVITSLNRVPIIVERAMYLDSQGQVFGAGHESAGMTAPATTWFLAEGATGPYFDLFVLVANPAVQPARVTATYLRPDGSTVTKAYTVPGTSRFNIWVDFEDARLADTAVSTTLVSDVPILVERAMWWPGSYATWQEAHNSFGATVTGTAWALGLGEVGGAPFHAETYVLVANTASTEARVAVSLLFDDDTAAVTREFLVAPTSRFNVDVRAEFSEAAGRRFGVWIESLPTAGRPAAPIVVEQALYHDDGSGRHWAAGANALATRIR